MRIQKQPALSRSPLRAPAVPGQDLHKEVEGSAERPFAEVEGSAKRPSPEEASIAFSSLSRSMAALVSRAPTASLYSSHNQSAYHRALSVLPFFPYFLPGTVLPLGGFTYTATRCSGLSVFQT